MSEPLIIELRALGIGGEDKALLLDIAALLLAAHGIETCPVDHGLSSFDVVLPPDWRGLPIVAHVYAAEFASLRDRLARLVEAVERKHGDGA